MSDETVKTQGCQLFVIDDLSSSEPEIVRFNCPTGITGIGGGAAAQIPTTCLEDLEGETSVPGLNQTSPLTVPYNFKPVRVSHRIVWDLKRAKRNFRWMVCLSEGGDPPTLDSNGAFEAPMGRTSIEFDAYVDTNALDIANNEIVRGTMTLVQSAEGQVEHWNGPALVD